jgi:hypothetical protein
LTTDLTPVSGIRDRSEGFFAAFGHCETIWGGGGQVSMNVRRGGVRAKPSCVALRGGSGFSGIKLQLMRNKLSDKA